MIFIQNSTANQIENISTKWLNDVIDLLNIFKQFINKI